MKKLQNKLQEKLQNRKQNNKGFSLVELIIVIAIMAILVGIVGTQVIPYIEKSRKAKDIQLVSGLCTDAMTAFSSCASKVDPAQDYTITLSGTDFKTVAVTPASAKGKDDLETEFKSLNNVDSKGISFESKAAADVDSIQITCTNDATKKMITVKTFDGATEVTDFKVESN